MKTISEKVKIYKCNKDKLHQVFDDEADSLLILSASYEDRCVAVTENFNSKYQCENTLVFWNEEVINRGKTKENLDKLLKRAESFSKCTKDIKTSLESPRNIISAMHKYISRETINFENKCITIDITTFPRQELLLLLRYMKMLNPNGKMRILYTKPQGYGEWLSKGFKGVITFPSFAGTQIPGRKKLLIILTGFEEERMQKLWEEHEPSKTILIIGNPPTSNEFLAINKLKSSMLLNISKYVFEEQAPANDPFKFFEVMENILNEHKKNYNIFVSPLNTKIQTVGLFLLFEKYNWFQITIALPNDYNVESYSSGQDEIYEFYI